MSRIQIANVALGLMAAIRSMALGFMTAIASMAIASMTIATITIASISTALILAGCSSEPNTTNYYLLNNPTSTAVIEREVIEYNPPVTVLLSVQLAQYLTPPYIVMQMNNHKIHYATFNMWAAPLADETFKSLQLDLNAMSNTRKFETELRGNKANAHAQLSVHIDYFHVTAQSKVILSGRYQYTTRHTAKSNAEVSQSTNQSTNQSTSLNISQAFSFTAPLQADGYSQSVAQMRILVLKLAQQIDANIEY